MRAVDYQEALRKAMDTYFHDDMILGMPNSKEMVDSVKTAVMEYFMLNAEKVEQTRVLLSDDRLNVVYIAGPMTGLPEYNFPAFNEAAEMLRMHGKTVYNPAEHGLINGATWADYMRFDVGNLVKCESIYLLPGWSQSRGARTERKLAIKLGIEVLFAPGAEQPME